MMPDSAALPVDRPKHRVLAAPAAQFRRLRQALESRPFLRNVSIMLSGSAGGQMISILLSPLLTRLYTPQDFGILSVYSAALTIGVVIASLRYELALPLVRREEEALNLMAVCLCVLLLTTGGLCLTLFALPAAWIHQVWPVPVGNGGAGLYLGLLIGGYFCLGAYYIALQLATRAGAFPAIAKTRLAQGAVGPTSQIGLALAGLGTPGLLLGNIAGQSAGTFGLFAKMVPGLRALWRVLSWRAMAAQARRYIRFPLISSWAALIDAAGSSQLLYLLVTLAFDPRIAGLLFLVERVIARPLTIVGTSILQVYIGEAGQIAASDPARLRRRFYQVVGRQFLLALGWVVLANIAGALTFKTVFGAQWEEGVLYLQAMSLGYLAQAVVQPVFHTLQILEKQGLAAGWQIGRLCFTVAIFLGGVQAGLSAPWVIALYGVAQALCCGILLLLMIGAIGRRVKEINP